MDGFAWRECQWLRGHKTGIREGGYFNEGRSIEEVWGTIWGYTRR